MSFSEQVKIMQCEETIQCLRTALAARDAEIEKLRTVLTPFAVPKQLCCASDDDHYRGTPLSPARRRVRDATS